MPLSTALIPAAPLLSRYSNTLSGVMADNSFSDCNVRNGGNVGNASVGAYGACYNGPGAVWYTEFTGNTQLRSDGIAFEDQQVGRNAREKRSHHCPVAGTVPPF